MTVVRYLLKMMIDARYLVRLQVVYSYSHQSLLIMRTMFKECVNISISPMNTLDSAAEETSQLL